MYGYELIEFGSEKTTFHISSSSCVLEEVLTEFYKDKLDKIVDERGHPRGFVSIFVNANQITSIKTSRLQQHDAIVILSSIAGG